MARSTLGLAVSLSWLGLQIHAYLSPSQKPQKSFKASTSSQESILGFCVFINIVDKLLIAARPWTLLFLDSLFAAMQGCKFIILHETQEMISAGYTPS